MDERSIEAAASTLWDLWTTGSRIPQLPDDRRPLTIDEGWAIQRAMDGRAGPIGGWKLAATSPSGQAAIGVDGPLLGVLYGPRLLENGATVSAPWMGMVEAEFAFRMSADLPATDAPFSRDSVLAGVGAAHGGIEVPDSRLSNYPTLSAAQMVADTMCAHSYVVGSELAIDLAELAGTELVIFRNGVEAARGRGADILGDPVDALVWLANALAATGQSLRAGDIVTTGGCALVLDVVAGDVITATYGGIESVAVTIAPGV